MQNAGWNNSDKEETVQEECCLATYPSLPIFKLIPQATISK